MLSGYRKKFFKLNEAAEIITTEETAWIIKYLMAESEERNEFFIIRTGIILIRLISIPSQIVNHEEAEIETTVPAIAAVKKEYKKFKFNIKKEK